MTFFDLAILFAALVTGMLGIPIGILPSILLFRDLANGVDSSPETKQRYAITLWGGMIAGWILMSLLVWWVLTILSNQS